MSFILLPNVGEEDVKINAWNWRPTIEFLRVEGVIDDETAERMTTHGCSGTADADMARRMGAAIERKLEEMCEGERIRANLSITAAPRKVARFDKPNTINAVDLYSASYAWLVEFKDFCKRCGGFRVS